MPTSIILTFLMLLMEVCYAQMASFNWVRRAGGSDTDIGFGIDIDNFGNRVITGYYEGTATFGDFILNISPSGQRDIFVAKYNDLGDVLWANHAGGAYLDMAKAVVTDEHGNSFITGTCGAGAIFDTIELGGSGIFAAKYNSQGNLVWARAYGSHPENIGNGITLDNTGNILVTGRFFHTTLFGTVELTASSSSDVFIAKLDSSGNVIWAKQAGGLGNDFGEAICADESGNPIIAGSFKGIAFFDSVKIDAGISQKMFIAKYDALGNIIWVNGGEISNGTEEGFGIATDVSGNILVTGAFDGTADFGSSVLTSAGYTDMFIAKYDSKGKVIWVKQAGGLGHQFGTDIVCDGIGNVFVTGTFENELVFEQNVLTGFGDTDVFIAKFNPMGELLWAKQAGNPDYDFVYDISAAASSECSIIGRFRNSAAFGTCTVVSSGGDDVYVASISETKDLSAPAQPRNLQASDGDMQIILSWSPNTEPDLKYYKILRSQSSGFIPQPTDSIAIVFMPDTNYVDNSVINGVNYYYRISAVDSSGNESEFSDEIKATPRGPILIGVPQDVSTIQAGIDAALNGDTVLVSPGTYYENINFKGKAIVVKSEAGAENTIIDGTQSGSVVTFKSGEDTTSVISGFTITNGKAIYGAGIYTDNGSSPKIVNNDIKENLITETSGSGGSGVFIQGGHAIVKGNIIRNNNSGGDGGGLHLNGTENILVEKNIIKDNIAKAAGGMLIYGGENIQIFRNLVIGNRSNGTGGGIHCLAQSGIISNNTIDSNSSGVGWKGGGLYFNWVADVIVRNNIITNNLVGGGIRGESGKNIHYNNVWNNEGGNYLDCSPNADDISADPQFVDPESEDYHLKFTSLCIDAGDPASPFDPDGTRADMGAFFFDQRGLDITPPATPSSLKAIPQNERVALSWFHEEEPDLSHFKIYRYLTAGIVPSNQDSIGAMGRKARYYIDKNVQNGTTYYYRISAVDSSGNESELSDEASALPLPSLWTTPSLSIYKTSQPPNIDGKISESCWNLPGIATGFVIFGLDEFSFAADQTVVHVCYDNQNLYIGFQVMESDVSAYKQAATSRDGAVWDDDEIEFYFGLAGEREPYYHLIVNVANVQFDELVWDPQWNCDFISATSKGAGGWSCEIAIPFASLSIPTPINATEWYVNFCRHQFGGRNLDQWQNWAGILAGGFHQPESFGKMTFVGLYQDIEAPSKPQQLTAQGENSRVRLGWHANTETDLRHYQIYRSMTKGFTPHNTDSLVVVLKPDITFLDMRVTNGQTYYYRISAVDSAGNKSEFSDESSATPQGPSPILNVDPLTWNAPISGGTSPSVLVTNIGSSGIIFYSVSKNVSWLTLSATDGSTPGSFAMTAAANNTGLDRSGSVIVSASGVSGSPKTIAVYQNVSPDISLSSSSHDFGQVNIGSGSTWQLSVINTGASALVVSDITCDNAIFQAQPRSFSVPVFSNQYVSVSITPVAIRNESGTMSIHCNDVDEATVAVSLFGAGVDLTPPSFDLSSSQLSVPLNAAAPISATVTDNAGLQLVQLFYRQGGQSIFQSLNMSSSSGSIFTAQVPSSAVTFGGLMYYISAQDIGGHTSTSDTLQVRVYFDDGALTTESSNSAYLGGFPRDQWRMISIPAALQVTSVNSLLGDESTLGRYGEPNWRLFRWEDNNGDGKTDGYVEYKPADSRSENAFTSGKAYWLKANPAGEKVVFDAGAGQSTELTEQTIALQPGWNQIGSPFAFSTRFVANHADIVNQLYAANDSGGYDLTQTFHPWEGYFVYLRGTVGRSMIISPWDLPVLKKKAVEEKGWELQLIASSGQWKDQINYLGVSSIASDRCDALDLPEPPVMENGISLAFPHADWEEDAGFYTADFRLQNNEGHVWEIVLHGGEGSNARLQWSFTKVSETPIHLKLFSLYDGQIFDMTESDKLDCGRLPKDGEMHFRVIAGNEAFVAGQTVEFKNSVPAAFSLFPAYPNPFSSSTTIGFELPHGGQIDLTIYNLLGQQIRQLQSDVDRVGRHQIVWDGLDGKGKRAASGLYCIVVKAGADLKTIKVVKME
jgi:fibronectin type 3 domain-containing protein